MFHRIRVSALSLILLLAFGTMLPAKAQPTPTAGPPATLQVAFPVEKLPSPEAEVHFLRYTFGPGAQLPAAPQIGSTLLAVESGEITLTTDQPVSVKNGGQLATPSPATSHAGETTLGPTQGALIPDGTLVSMRNDSDQEAQLLVLRVFSQEQNPVVNGADGSPAAESSGVNVQ
ncbi:MAG TPA: hypothetical protein VGR29_01370 [Thermomicrobiales bacterium]|nr:hypothetical protein [Thermomicrobiales bacterium]